MTYIVGTRENLVDTGRFRIWAENGFVKVEDREGGDYRVLHPKEWEGRYRAVADLVGSTLSRKQASIWVPMTARLGVGILNELERIGRLAWEQRAAMQEVFRPDPIE